MKCRTEIEIFQWQDGKVKQMATRSTSRLIVLYSTLYTSDSSLRDPRDLTPPNFRNTVIFLSRPVEPSSSMCLCIKTSAHHRVPAGRVSTVVECTYQRPTSTGPSRAFFSLNQISVIFFSFATTTFHNGSPFPTTSTTLPSQNKEWKGIFSWFSTGPCSISLFFSLPSPSFSLFSDTP